MEILLQKDLFWVLKGWTHNSRAVQMISLQYNHNLLFFELYVTANSLPPNSSGWNCAMKFPSKSNTCIRPFSRSATYKRDFSPNSATDILWGISKAFGGGNPSPEIQFRLSLFRPILHSLVYMGSFHVCSTSSGITCPWLFDVICYLLYNQVSYYLQKFKWMRMMK